MPKFIPTSPGVYLHKNDAGDVIYVGKARNLRKRIAQYTPSKQHDEKTALLVKHIHDSDFIVTNNELEALLLENQLIKKYKPKYNILLKDAQKYFYIQITKEAFPRVLVTRRTNKTDKFFGPYVKSMLDIIKMARQLFGLRACGRLLPKKPCFYYQISQCSGPCAGAITQEQYAQNVADLMHFIRHGDETLRREYEDAMHEASKKQDFERALTFRKRLELLERLIARQSVDTFGSHDQDVIGIATVNKKSALCLLKLKRGTILNKLSYVFVPSDDLLDEFLKAYYSSNPAPREIIVGTDFDPAITNYLETLWAHAVSIATPSRGTKKELLNLAQKNAYAELKVEDPTLIALKEMLKLEKTPHIIDCIDISNYGESVIVGACVQFKDKEPYKTHWRAYTIQGDFGQDDFRSMHEVIKRRYAKMPLPDLLVIDGGVLQVKFALQALSELGATCPVVGLAKREETIIFPGGEALKLNRQKAESKLIIRMRDAVHNFALRYSRKQFTRTYKHSQLDDIVGIGSATKFKLLNSFASLDAIKNASFEDLEKAIGSRATLVYNFFHKD
jgi:excinuclease ABC subunit C